MRPPARDWWVPEGSISYVIGDIHGRVDLLDELLERIADDESQRGAKRRCLLFLGDYIDRGPASREVVDRLLNDPLPTFHKVFLLGNHEQVMLRYLNGDLRVARHWLQKGGMQAVSSYGLDVALESLTDDNALESLRKALKQAIPNRHMEFYKQLKASHREGDYYFAHAGILPGTPLERQTVRDLVWIRGRFHRSVVDHGVRVVHGHEVVPRVEVRTNRIGIDTGAYRTGVLTSLVLHTNKIRFLQTGQRGDPDSRQNRLDLSSA